MDKIVVFETFYNPIEANIVKARLIDGGVQCFLSDENSITINPLYTQALGGVKLHLFEKDIKLAESILKNDGVAASLKEETDQIEDEGQTEQSGILCPMCNSSHVGYVQATKKRFSLPTMLVSFLLYVYPFQVNKVHHCFDCGHEFEI